MGTNTIDRTRLITVHNYAKKIGKTTTWVYKLIATGRLKAERIDGMIFILQ